jgi:hypothetical protein
LRERERERQREKKEREREYKRGTTFSCPRPKLKTEKSDSALTLDSGIWETVPMSASLFFF